MKAILFSLLLALLACSVSAYVSNFEYYSTGIMRASYVTPGTGNQNRGMYLFKYQAKSKSLDFYVISTLASVGTVSINGPISCYNKQNGGTYGQDQSECASNTADVLIKLGKGVAPAEGETLGYQIFKGTTTLSGPEESMLFKGELNVQVNTMSTDPTTGKKTDTPSLRGQVYMYDHNGNNFYSFLVFGNNRGEFDREKSKSSNFGFGLVSHNPEQADRLNVLIYTTIKQPGNYILKCNAGTKTLGQDNNPFETQITFSTNEIPLLLELLLEKSCYIFITSAEATNGDLYSYFYNMGSFEAVGTGAQQSPPVTSAYLAYSLATFDASYKTLDILTKHNITDTITAAHVTSFDGTVLCDLARDNNPLPIRSFCRLNSTYLDALESGDLYVNIRTTTNPGGEVRGPLVFNSKKSSAIARSASAVSDSASIGLGVGLGIGIPILLVAAVGIFYLAKKGGSGGGGKI